MGSHGNRFPRNHPNLLSRDATLPFTTANHSRASTDVTGTVASRVLALNQLSHDAELLRPRLGVSPLIDNREIRESRPSISRNAQQQISHHNHHHRHDFSNQRTSHPSNRGRNYEERVPGHGYLSSSPLKRVTSPFADRRMELDTQSSMLIGSQVERYSEISRTDTSWIKTPYGETGRSAANTRKSPILLRPTGHVGGQSSAPVEMLVPGIQGPVSQRPPKSPFTLGVSTSAPHRRHGHHQHAVRRQQNTCSDTTTGGLTFVDTWRNDIADTKTPHPSSRQKTRSLAGPFRVCHECCWINDDILACSRCRHKLCGKCHNDVPAPDLGHYHHGSSTEGHFVFCHVCTWENKVGSECRRCSHLFCEECFCDPSSPGDRKHFQTAGRLKKASESKAEHAEVVLHHHDKLSAGHERESSRQSGRSCRFRSGSCAKPKQPRPRSVTSCTSKEAAGEKHLDLATMPNATSCAGRYRGGSTLLPSPGLVRDRLNRFERNIVPSKLPTKASTPRRVFDPDAYFSPLRESHGHPKHHSHHRRRSSSQSPSHSKHVSLQSSIRHHQVVCPSGGIDKPAQVAKVEPKRSWLSIFGVSPSEPSHSHKSKSEVCVSKSVRSINRARQHSSNRATSRAVSRGRSVNASRSSDCGSVTPARNRSGRSASFHDPLITAPPRREPSATGLRPSSALKKRDSKTEETLTTTETLRSSPNGLKSTSRHASGKYSNVGRVSPYAIVPGGIKRTPSRKIIVASVAPLTANGLLSSRAIGTAYYATRNDASSMLSVPASDGAADERDGPLAQSICTHMQLSDGPTSEGCLQCLEDQWHSVKANNQGWKTISLGPVKSTITSNGTVVELEKDFDETVNVRGLSVLIRLEGVPGQAEGIKSRSGTEVGEENVKGDKSWRPELEDGSCMEVGNRRSLRGSATVMALIGDA